jgi:hypothetical protein
LQRFTADEWTQDDTFQYLSEPDLSLETDFTGFEVSQPVGEDNSHKEFQNSVSGKLLTHCPVFFNSLSVWEREVVNSSDWLQKVTTKVSPYSL